MRVGSSQFPLLYCQADAYPYCLDAFKKPKVAMYSSYRKTEEVEHSDPKHLSSNVETRNPNETLDRNSPGTTVTLRVQVPIIYGLWGFFCVPKSHKYGLLGTLRVFYCAHEVLNPETLEPGPSDSHKPPKKSCC